MSPSLDNFRAKATSILTKTAHLSTPFIATFLLIHLAAPASATVGGSQLASQTMLLGREYYQTSLTEPLLVLGPLALHTLSGSLKRLLSPPGKPPRPFNSLLTLTGYSAMLLFLPIHFFIHRIAPTNPLPPIDALGPSELDYEFVKTGLHTWPIRSWLLYGGLVLSVTTHMADGVGMLLSTWISLKPSNRITRRTKAWVFGALPALLGLYFLCRESSTAFHSMESRHRAVFMMSNLFKM